MTTRIPHLFVGCQNDVAFVIDQPPRPSATDDPVHGRKDVTVYAACGSDFILALELAAAWNAVLERRGK